MLTDGRYSFRAVTLDDARLVAAWRATPHVREWWGDPEDPPFDASDLADARVARWIVHCDGQPFAFMQDYTVHGWEEHHFAGLALGARGIDQYIGEAGMLGRGHGTAFIGARMRTLFAAAAPVIATDPHPNNARAIATYAKLGFAPAGPPQETQWGLILPMLAPRGAA